MNGIEELKIIPHSSFLTPNSSFLTPHSSLLTFLARSNKKKYSILILAIADLPFRPGVDKKPCDGAGAGEIR